MLRQQFFGKKMAKNQKKMTDISKIGEENLQIF